MIGGEDLIPGRSKTTYSRRVREDRGRLADIAGEDARPVSSTITFLDAQIVARSRCVQTTIPLPECYLPKQVFVQHLVVVVVVLARFAPLWDIFPL
jgi:hypothetical protein